VAIHLVADRPILAERPLYTTAAIAPGITANDGHVAPGATGTTTCARFADVEAAGGNVSYLTLANPAGAAVEVTPTVWLDGTRSVQPPVPVAAGSRLTLDLARFLPAGRHGSSTTYGLELRSSSPFMVEEPQYLEMAGAAANGASLVEPSPCPPSPD
jgi:hypothetical protein